LQLPAAQHPDIAIVECPQFGDQRIHVLTYFERPFRFLDRL